MLQELTALIEANIKKHTFSFTLAAVHLKY